MLLYPFLKIIILTILIIISLVLFAIPVRKRLQIIKSAPGKFNLDNIGARLKRVIFEVLFQTKIIKHRPIAGLMHAFVMWGFLAFIFITTNHFTKGCGWNFIGHGTFYNCINSIVTVFAVICIIGITVLFIRRFIIRPKSLGEHLSWGSVLVAFLIEGLMITYLLDVHYFAEGSRAASINWWIHSLMILGFLSYIPQSKHLHLVLGPFTVFLKDLNLARIKPLDFEKEELGAEKLSDLEKHTVLGAFSCVECGRCFDHCPARNTGKVLDPKQWILDLKAGLLENPAMEDPGKVLNFEMIWQCTTCGACTYQCPVGIEHVIPIIEFRRGFVSGGEFPSPMRALFDNLERSGNPWKYQPHEALEFIEGAGIPFYKEQEVIYWMGCMGRFDENYRKVSKSFAGMLKDAGVDFGVLKDEKCTGDTARRAGNEMIFQMLAEENIEMLNATKAKKLIATCPHCVRTIWEYKDMGLREDLEIVHHTAFMSELSDAGKLKTDASSGKSAVYHDACYLSRYLAPDGVNNPRKVMKSAGIDILEAGRSKDQSFCCGAGGGMLFSEETEGTRINHERVEELTGTGAKTIATSCPFCQMMFRDGLADKGKEDVEVLDIVQLISKK